MILLKIIVIYIVINFTGNFFLVTQPAFTCSKFLGHRFGGFILNFEHISHLCSSISIANFGHAIAGWEGIFTNSPMKWSKTEIALRSYQLFSGTRLKK